MTTGQPWAGGIAPAKDFAFGILSNTGMACRLAAVLAAKLALTLGLGSVAK